jgi:co-chaperonin GroES (HSP10)
LVNLHGNLISTTIEVGTIVVFPAFGGQRITVKGDEYIVMKEQDLLAIIEE